MDKIAEKIAEFIFWFIFTILLYWTGYIVLNIISLGYIGKILKSLKEKSLKWEVIENYFCIILGFSFYLFAFHIGNNLYDKMHLT